MSTKQPIKQSEISVPVEIIQNKIYLIRGHKVMLDRDLAKLYNVQTFRLNEQVKRNIKRFPDDCVPRTYSERRFILSSYDAVQMMRAGLSQSAGKSRLQTTLSCFD